MKETMKIANDSVAGIHATGRVTMVVADGAMVEEGQLVKLVAGKITPTGDADRAYGVAEDSAGAGEICPVAVLGAATGSVLMIADAAIPQGSYVQPSDIPGQAATHNGGQIVGVAMEAGVAGELFEVAPLSIPGA